MYAVYSEYGGWWICEWNMIYIHNSWNMTIYAVNLEYDGWWILKWNMIDTHNLWNMTNIHDVGIGV